MYLSCLPHPVVMSDFIICSGCVLYVSFGCKVRPMIFWCIPMGCACVVYFEVKIALIFHWVWSEIRNSLF